MSCKKCDYSPCICGSNECEKEIPDNMANLSIKTKQEGWKIQCGEKNETNEFNTDT